MGWKGGGSQTKGKSDKIGGASEIATGDLPTRNNKVGFRTP